MTRGERTRDRLGRVRDRVMLFLLSRPIDYPIYQRARYSVLYSVPWGIQLLCWIAFGVAIAFQP